MSEEYIEWRERWPRVVINRDTQVAIELLTGYYSTRNGGMPCYTGARFEQTARLNTDPDVIGPPDFVAVSLLSVDVPKEAAIRLLSPETSSEISSLLNEIPTELDIIDADDEMLTGDCAANKLWTLLRSGRDGIGPTKASKLIAAKRPRLIPIWDSFVERATGLDTVDYWRKFRSVLVADDRAIWNWLEGLRGKVTELPDQVATLRILDVILWMLVDTDALDS